MKLAYRGLLGVSVAMGAMHWAAGNVAAEVVATNFANPSFFGQPSSTYQFWNGFATAEGPNAPSAINNPAATISNAANAYLANGSAGVLLLGTFPNHRLYGPEVMTLPTVVVPNFDYGVNGTTELILQVEASATPLDINSVTVTPLGGSPVVVGASDWTSAASPTPGRTDYRYSWILPGNVASYTLKFNAQGTSSSLAGLRVDTFTTVPAPAPVPEPMSLATLGAGAGLMLLRRRRTA